MASVQRAQVFGGGDAASEHMSALNEAGSAVEECMGLAFRSLRDLRMALSSRIEAQWVADKSALATAQVAELSGVLEQIQAAMPPEADDPGTVEKLAAVQDWCGSITAPDNVSESLASIAKLLAQKSSAPSTRLAKTMQVRDAADQRMEHIYSTIAALEGADQSAIPVMQLIVAAQLRGVAEILQESQSAASQACSTLALLTSEQGSSLGPFQMPCDQAVPGMSSALVGAPSDGGMLGKLCEDLEKLAIASGDQEAAGMLSACQQLGPMVPRVTSAMAELTGAFAEKLQAVETAVDQFANAIAGLQFVADDLSQSAEVIEAAVAAGGPVTIIEAPEVDAIWALYTMDGERDVHNKVLSELSSQAR